MVDFKQKLNETIEEYYDRLNELIFKCNRYRVVSTALEFNLTFILGLRKEWRNMCLMIKTQENFDTYSLSNLYNILKAHQYEVKEIAKENKMNFGGPMGLVSKTTAKQNESDEEAKEGEEGFILNYEDAVVAYYSNNRVKKFFKKPINGNFKKSSAKKPIMNTCSCNIPTYQGENFNFF